MNEGDKNKKEETVLMIKASGGGGCLCGPVEDLPPRAPNYRALLTQIASVVTAAGAVARAVAAAVAVALIL